MQHPRRNRKRGLIGELATYQLVMKTSFAEADRQRLAYQWMPTIVDCDGPRLMGIM